nr:hypothetical protein [Muribaculaceae bacterium]
MSQTNNPWIALSTYEEYDEYRFFGREIDIANLMSMLEQNECIVIYAASGDGKSSVINAGLVPAMRRKGFFPIKITFTTEELNGKNILRDNNSSKINFDKLIWSKILDYLNQYQRGFQRKHNLREDFTIGFVNINTIDMDNNINLWKIFRSSIIQDSLGVSDYVPVIIFDQFEEVLRCTWRSEFFAWLENLMRDTPLHQKNVNLSANSHFGKLFKLILSMRYEYVGELDYWCSQRYFIPQIMQNRYFLKPLSKNQALCIIKSTKDFDETSKIIAEYAEVIIENITSNNHSSENFEDVVPAIILSLTCYVLYNEWQENEDLSLSEIGLNDMIYDYYRAIITRIGITDSQRRIIERVLISGNGSRLRIPISDERLKSINCNGFLFSEKNLIDEHIVKCDKSNGETYVEFIHDKLAESIFKRREVEANVINKETKSKHFKNTLLLTLLLVVLLAGVLFTRYSLTNNIEDITPEVAHVKPKAKSFKRHITIKDLLEVMSDSLDYDHATSLSMASNLDTCRSYHQCYKNTFNLNNHFLRYAGNAKQLVIPYQMNHGLLKFGNNTEKVILFYPELVDSISTINRLTEIYVPFNKYEQTLMNQKFRDVTILRMGYIQTFYEKLSYALYQEHSHFQGKQIPLWMVVILGYALIIISILITLKNVSKTQKIKYAIVSLPLTILTFILFIEMKWLGWFNSINPVVVIIAANVAIVIMISIVSMISKKIY